METRRVPLVLIPGIQGRWEWMRPAVRALQATFDVLTFSLQEARHGPFFEAWHQIINRRIAACGTSRVPVIGVSFGGVIAATYAATYPARVSHVILVSPPAPDWRLDRQSARYVRHPTVLLPAFATRSIIRLGPEIVAALPTWPRRGRFVVGHVWRTLRWPAAPTQMALWVREWLERDIPSRCRTVTAPTLVMTGESELDRVVPVADSLAYQSLIPGARHRTLSRTGHLGLVTRPDDFRRIVTDFVTDAANARRDTDTPRRQRST
jgi:3-oxoadipate enol-lactonase